MTHAWPEEETTDIAVLAPSPTYVTPKSPWTAEPPPPPAPTSTRDRVLTRISELRALPSAEISLRRLDLWFALSASAAFGAIGVIVLLELIA